MRPIKTDLDPLNDYYADECDEEESTCRKPCDPNSGCEECVAYWERMEREGYWDRQNHKWTEKGWREITK